MADEKGMLVSFTGVDPAFEVEHNEWFNREHIDERALDTPGFFRARRYAAIEAPIKYFATYETESWRVLASPQYLDRVGNQTEWSRRVIRELRTLYRMTTRITIDAMHGIGGVATAVRFFPSPNAGQQHALRESLRTTFPTLVKRPGMIGACLTENMPEAANATGDKARAVGGNPMRADRVEWLAVLEGAEAEATTTAANDVLSLGALQRFGVAQAPVIGTYRFVYGIYR
ncbi:MAG: hypothetical protein FJX65_12515 [Alphaproteobacteria bacterium]|nr:hypothetical protein [Alphaproteobacteria bacterium]